MLWSASRPLILASEEIDWLRSSTSLAILPLGLLAQAWISAGQRLSVSAIVCACDTTVARVA